MSGLKEKVTIAEDGTIHMPVVARSRPGHPRGTFKLVDCDLDDHKNKHVVMTPGKENVVLGFTFKSSSGQFEFKKQYNLTMRFQTHDDQPEPLQVVVKRGKPDSPPVYETKIPLPNTNGEWQTLEPLPLEVEIGGSPDTHLEFRHPLPTGKGIAIRDFSLIPFGADQVTDYSTQWWCMWLDRTKKNLVAEEQGLPPERLLDPEALEAFTIACQDEIDARKKEEQAKADAAKKAAIAEHKEAQERTYQTALPLLESMDSKLKALDWKENTDLLQCIILAHSTPNQLADYCAKGEEHTRRLQQFLDDADKMLLFLIHGGARGGRYPRALEILEELQQQDPNNTQKGVLQRLALAVALELCEPLPVFGTPQTFVDPIRRYYHYKQAYLDGELDPFFESFSTWELRHVVNSEAPDEQLAWCREMVRNYYPSIATMDDMHWRYSWLVRSDCHYKAPEWTKSPHDFKQLISGGGKCGPRAWLGRYVCRAFGHPVWGVRQKGHAAVLRWEPKGWDTALGCGIDGSWWQERRARDFVRECEIRDSPLGDEGYLYQAEILDYFGLILGEKQEMYVHPKSVWYSLAKMQRKRLAEANEHKLRQLGACEIRSKITELREVTSGGKEKMIVSEDGSIHLPVDARADGRKVKQMRSFGGGAQVYLKGEDCNLRFRIPAELIPERKAYMLSARVVTIHENDPYPLLVSIEQNNDKNAPREYSIPLPYTEGALADTSSVKVELGGDTETMKLSRKSPVWAFALKSLVLKPCN